jgi:hypothetical protein
MATLNQEELEAEDLLEETPVEGDEPDESNDEQPEEKPKEGESQNIDYHTPEKPQKTEKEKAEFALKSMALRVKDLGGDPASLVGTKESDSTQFVTKADLTRLEVKRLATSEKEVEAIMSWVEKGLSVEDAHLLANKSRVKSVFSEFERGNVQMQEATGAGQKKPVVRAPAPSEAQMSMWKVAKMAWDPQTKTAKGKFTEVYYNGSDWVSRRLK